MGKRYRIRYERDKDQWVSDDGHLVRLKWGYGHNYEVPVSSTKPVRMFVTRDNQCYNFYLSHFFGEFYIQKPRHPQHDLPLYEFFVDDNDPIFLYFRKVFVRDGKEYERTLGHDESWQSYGHDDGVVLSYVVKKYFLPTNM